MEISVRAIDFPKWWRSAPDGHHFVRPRGRLRRLRRRGSGQAVAQGSQAGRCRARGPADGEPSSSLGVSTTTGTPAIDGCASSSRERGRTDRARADRRVPVPLGAALVERVVGVHQPEPARADGRLERVERRRHPARDGQVVPGRPRVAGVEADADQRVVLQRGQVGPEVLDGRGERLAAAGRRLDQQPRPAVRQRRRAPAAAARAAGAAPRRTGPHRRPTRRARRRRGSRAGRRAPGCARWRRSTARRSPRWGSRR